ncbi:DUF5593 domain-containing protein [Rhodococcus erythropolis]|uniref:GAF domain-containing protein n=1 Tax=Rhodococcus erythropolis TaxID=1833 RepID=UPI001E481EAB|nr:MULTISPECIES: GAF domain-containing protein [Rhodococcus erythropolis group]MCD2104890.1 DUF5593 domain-containing protein [Rhodococcus qingshengii]MCZ4528338.1 DUF5593 domain-containing protein [Rhodococcus erythropolis]MDJ0015059.1 DUF5593 domain-containing protein [Rhodococcus erythropolis]
MSRKIASQWILVDTLSDQPKVCAVGDTVKNRTPLQSILRVGADAVRATEAITAAVETGEPVLLPHNSRHVFCEPIQFADGQTHGVWLRIAHLTDPAPERNRAWAFRWYIDKNKASVSKPLQEASNETEWTIAEALEIIDLGEESTIALATLLASKHGSIHHSTVLQTRPSGVAHAVDFICMIRNEDGERILRGISHDLGPAVPPRWEPRPRPLAAVVADGLINTGEYRAVFCLKTLKLICWYGASPPSIAWRRNESGANRKILHPDDYKLANELIQILSAGSNSGEGSSVRNKIRLLTVDGDYRPFNIRATRVSMEGVSAGLAIISPTD